MTGGTRSTDMDADGAGRVTVPDPAAARVLDSPQPGRFFHGAIRRFEPGEMAEPGHPPNFPASSPEFVYFTATVEAAARWARDAAEMPHDRVVQPRVYEVRPTSDYERDPNGDNPWDFRSRHSLVIVRETAAAPGAWISRTTRRQRSGTPAPRRRAASTASAARQGRPGSPR